MVFVQACHQHAGGHCIQLKSFFGHLPHCLAGWPQVGKAGGLVFGVQTAPMLQLGGLFSSSFSSSSSSVAGSAAAQLDRPSWSEAARQCQLATSYAVAYQPAAASSAAYGGRFTAAVELVRDRELAISFLHHMAVQRQVRNPFEASGAWVAGGACACQAPAAAAGLNPIHLPISRVPAAPVLPSTCPCPPTACLLPACLSPCLPAYLPASVPAGLPCPALPGCRRGGHHELPGCGVQDGC
jgi:hypothetical protein